MARPINIGTVFHDHAEQAKQTTLHLDRPFDIAPDGGLVYDGAALARLVDDTAASLYAAGARPGDRIGVVKDNHFDFVLLAAAATRIGAVPANIAAANSLPAVRALLERLDPALVVLSASVLRRAIDAGDDVLGGRRAIVLPSARAHVERAEIPGTATPLDDVRNAAAAPVRFVGDDEPLLMTHTSGTTGVPKLVVQSPRTLGAASRLELMPIPFVVSRRKDVVLSSISFAHWRAITWAIAQAKFAPHTLVAVADHEPERVGELLDRYRPTCMEACPNIFQRWRGLTRTHADALAGVRLYISTFDMVHPPTVRSFLEVSRRRLPLWVASWGQSEVGPISSAIFTRSRLRRLGNPVTSDVGWTVPTVSRVRVTDPETGKRRGLGRPGLLMASSRARCLNYLGESERHDRKDGGKWWNTGDIGYRDWLWRLRLVDREVDIIPGTSGLALESTLLDRIPEATEVTVLGVPGQLPVPVLCVDGDRLDERRWCAAVADLPPLADPIIVPWQDLPRTATWKVRRHELRASVLGTDAVYGTGRWT
ncbi:class I adenylate-forming enzyme family protein [Nocardia sp. NPDC004068]|uniref:class I adenylate-forming enzyme family protein n=1 Tax=Nocardia sp. NPDC004068 TaxID=3364303 RepID=UPI0036AC7941